MSQEEVMRVRRVGTGSEFRLLQDELEIGRVDGAEVIFLGFATRDDATLAAMAAHRALAPRRGEQASSRGRDNTAMLLPPAPEEGATGSWGFAMPLLPTERMEVFALARARIMWRAVQGTGIWRRMRQFADGMTRI
jgi:hypothetical protein